MYSPQDRIYTTPDVSIPSVKEMLQRLRLESVLRRAGFFSCCKPYRPPLTAAPNVRLPHITTNVEPFGDLERKGAKRTQTSRNIKVQENKSNRVALPSIKQTQQTKDYQTKRHTCWATEDHHVQSRPAAITKNCSYAQSPYQARQELYKAFYPARTVKLPSIPRENSAKKTQTQVTKPKTRSRDCAMCAELEREAKKEREKWTNPKKESNKRKRQRKKEQEFREWSESQENYYGKPLDFSLHDAPLFESQEKFHDINARRKRTEDIYRGGVGLTYVDLGRSNFQLHMASLPKVEKTKNVKKPKKSKTVKLPKKPKSDFKHIL